MTFCLLTRWAKFLMITIAIDLNGGEQPSYKKQIRTAWISDDRDGK
jgi:hypothetical protein